jgi:hypothetical protein
MKSATPKASHTNPASSDAILKMAVSYVPAPTTTHVSYFFNIGEAGEFTPDAVSPQVGDLDVARGRPLFTLRGCAADDAGTDGGTPCANGGAITIAAHPSFFDDTYGLRHPKVSLVSRRDDAVLDVSDSSSFDPYAFAKRDPGVHILGVYQGPAGPYGSGPSGAATGYQFQIQTMDEDGRFAAPRTFDLMIRRGYILGVDGLSGFDNQSGISDPTVWLGRSLEFFGLKGTFVKEGVGDSDADVQSFERVFEVGYRWDAHQGDYVHFGSARSSTRRGGN